MSEIAKEDYAEPRCPLCRPSAAVSVPVARIIEKLDSYLDAGDFAAADRHLRYWLSEAENGGDIRGALAVRNEQVGLYRKTGKKEECLEAAEAALRLIGDPAFAGTVTVGTTLVNVATGYKAFGLAERGLPLYRQAQRIYEERLRPDDCRLGGLYNNMALTLSGLGQYGEAEQMYRSAIGVMQKAEHGEAEIAITFLNLADLCAARDGLEAGESRINAYLDLAERCLDTADLPQDGYHAFVCEKCAPVFGYYGRFLTEEKYRERAKNIHERS